MATRRAPTRNSGPSHPSPEPSSSSKRRAPSFPPPDADEDAVFGLGAKRARLAAGADMPIPSSQSSSQHSTTHVLPPTPPPPPPPAPKVKKAVKAKSKANPRFSINPLPPAPSSQTPPSPTAQAPPQASSSKATMGPPATIPARPPARNRLSMRAKAARDPDDDEEEAHAGPSTSKKPRSKEKGGKTSRALDEEVEEGLEGGRLMDEIADEQVKRSKIVGRGPPAFEILSFNPPKPKSKSKPSSDPFALPAPPKPSSSHGTSTANESSDSMVPIPISDTPNIRKNKEMRENQSKKRNSFSQRGVRASASFGKGEATAPHPQVDTATFYKHIDGEDPEALRMRHLLVFVGKRVASNLALAGSAADVKGKGKAKAGDPQRTKEGEIIAAEVMEDVLRMLVKAKVDTNPQSARVINLQKSEVAHPANVLNKKVEKESEAFIKSGQAEEALWSAAVKAANALQTRTCDSIVEKFSSPAWADSLLDELEDEADIQAAELAKLVLSRDGGAEVPEDLEFSIHTMQQITQTAVQVSNESTRLMDSIFANLAQTLRDRDAAGQSSSSHNPLLSNSNSASGPSSLLNLPSASSSSSSVDPMATLRALASRAAAHPKPEALKAAAALSALGPSGTGAGPLPPTTPRRAAHPPTTPRRGTGTTPFRGARTPGPAE